MVFTRSGSLGSWISWQLPSEEQSPRPWLSTEHPTRTIGTEDAEQSVLEDFGLASVGDGPPTR